MSNTTIIARSRKRLRSCWSPFVISQRYEPIRARPSATDPDIGMTDVTGRKGDSPQGISPRADRRAVAAGPPSVGRRADAAVTGDARDGGGRAAAAAVR